MSSRNFRVFDAVFGRIGEEKNGAWENDVVGMQAVLARKQMQ
jgi:hypothetical protein